MLVNVTDVFTSEGKVLTQEFAWETAEITHDGSSYPVKSSSRLLLKLTNTAQGEALVEAKLQFVAGIPCDRCLEDVRYEFALDFAKHVDIGLSDAELTEELDESNFIDGYHLDVDKLLSNEILSGWPEKVLCKEDCKGLCPVCGQNLNTKSCDCEDTGLDPRMSVVRDLFKNFKEV